MIVRETRSLEFPADKKCLDWMQPADAAPRPAGAGEMLNLPARFPPPPANSGVDLTIKQQISAPRLGSVRALTRKLWLGLGLAGHQINDSAGVCVAGGGQFLLEGHTETIGSLFLTNSIGDVAPSLVDTGDATLSVQGDIAAVNDAPGVIPTIRGMLGFPGAAAAPSGAQKATSASSRWVKGNSSPRKPSSLIK